MLVKYIHINYSVAVISIKLKYECVILFANLFGLINNFMIVDYIYTTYFNYIHSMELTYILNSAFEIYFDNSKIFKRAVGFQLDT